jgi:hypothetical protein
MRPGLPTRLTVRPLAILLAVALAGLLGGCSAGTDDASAGSSDAAPAMANKAVADPGSALAPGGSDAASSGSSGSASGSGSSGAGSSGSSGSSGSGSSGSGSAGSDSQVADPAAPGSATSSANAAGIQRVRTAQLTLDVTGLPAAAARVRTVAAVLGGVVSAESSGFGPAGESVITLRVPEPKLDDALNRLAGVGQEKDLTTSSDDVTATLADLNSRVSSQARSVGRVRDLLDRATSLKDIVLIESELSRREADLEAVQARQRVLADQAALSTITVTLRTPTTVTTKPAKHDDGFVAGLKQGWDALTTSTTAVLTVLGAVLPIGIVLVALTGPAYLLFRRITRRPNRAHP